MPLVVVLWCPCFGRPLSYLVRLVCCGCGRVLGGRSVLVGGALVVMVSLGPVVVQVVVPVVSVDVPLANWLLPVSAGLVVAP